MREGKIAARTFDAQPALPYSFEIAAKEEAYVVPGPRKERAAVAADGPSTDDRDRRHER